jgi:hypothetical protein
MMTRDVDEIYRTWPWRVARLRGVESGGGARMSIQYVKRKAKGGSPALFAQSEAKSAMR